MKLCRQQRACSGPHLVCNPAHAAVTSPAQAWQHPAAAPVAVRLNLQSPVQHPAAAAIHNVAASTSSSSDSSTSSTVTIERPQAAGGSFFYDGVVFDMDGTLTEAHIDFADMRARTGIPVGDLFTVMEAWRDESQILRAMTVILDIEAEASRGVTLKAGLMELLQLLRDRKVRVALVTRNTPQAVEAFFSRLEPEWQQLFSPVLTRHFQYVKPDKRLLLHVAKEWGVDPSRLLMVGDSFEDVEVGNAAGTASCLIAGGGNEKPGANISPPPGAVPTFSVQGLSELAQRLRRGSDGDAEAAGLRLGWPQLEAAGLSVGPAGAPAPGLDFLDWLADRDALHRAECSFPRMGRAAGGLATCPQLGDRVLHVCCQSGALTKMLASQGMPAVGVDSDVDTAQRRGLTAVQFQGPALCAGSLSAVTSHGPFDVALVLGSDLDVSLQQRLCTAEALQEVRQVLQPGGRLCAQLPLLPHLNPAALLLALRHAGLQVQHWELLPQRPAVGGLLPELRLVACSTSVDA